ncbi:GntR family transcriptional regulator [Carboxydochorda subterranea]|uniref:GntR family transcriptional regulator n=1 Tax=Carboxydichorda subterranea TaxID=3109565 RepID=A0ABZ1BUM9_9FIRM|nr:GntR family transcriptional regulator [Limnochorda sp. L945t]WRP16293.1 GntR family transcriptional regulator [Limnochorda sp. L945t]
MSEELRIQHRRRRLPLYAEVQQDLRQLIQSWPRSAPLPSEPKLASQLGVSRPTVREALHALEREGLILRRQGVGTFVLGPDRSVTTGLEELRGIPRIIRASGKEPCIDHQQWSLEPATPDVAGALQVSPGDTVVAIRQVYRADGHPIALGVSRLPQRVGVPLDVLGREAIDAGQQGRPLFEVLDQVARRRVRYAVAEIAAELPDAELTALLEVDPATPLVKLTETHFDDRNVPIIHSVDYIVWHRFKLQIVRQRRT